MYCGGVEFYKYVRKNPKFVIKEKDGKVKKKIIGEKVGVFYSQFFTHWDEKRVYVGYSFCDKRFDKFDKYPGIDLAYDRSKWFYNAKTVASIIKSVPEKYRQSFFDFIYTVCKKGKDQYNYPEWVKEIESCYFDYRVYKSTLEV